MLYTRWFANSVLLGIAFIWGMTFVLVQDAVAKLPPFTFNFVRFGIAALLILLLLPGMKKKEKLTAKEWRIAIGGGILLGVFLFIGYAFQTFSLLFTTSAKAGFLTGLSVALVPLLAFFVLRQKPSLQAVIGVVLAVCGLYLLAFRDLNSINIGDLLAVVCAFGFGLQIVYTGKYSSRTSVFHLVLIQLATVSGLSGISAAVCEPHARLDLLADATVILALLVTSLFATALAFLAQTFFQKTTDPAQVALIYATEPVFAALADYVWNGTSMGMVSIVGFVFILIGMLLAEIPFSKYVKKMKIKMQKADLEA